MITCKNVTENPVSIVNNNMAKIIFQSNVNSAIYIYGMDGIISTLQKRGERDTAIVIAGEKLRAKYYTSTDIIIIDTVAVDGLRWSIP
jgi:methanogenic corrinoid protein MtbC1